MDHHDGDATTTRNNKQPIRVLKLIALEILAYKLGKAPSSASPFNKGQRRSDFPIYVNLIQLSIYRIFYVIKIKTLAVSVSILLY